MFFYNDKDDYDDYDVVSIRINFNSRIFKLIIFTNFHQILQFSKKS